MPINDDSQPARRDAFIERARVLLADDLRLRAGWLEGSLADGTSDPYSDVDLYLAIRDDAVDEVWAERLDLIGRVRPVLANAVVAAAATRDDALLLAPHLS